MPHWFATASHTDTLSAVERESANHVVAFSRVPKTHPPAPNLAVSPLHRRQQRHSCDTKRALATNHTNPDSGGAQEPTSWGMVDVVRLVELKKLLDSGALTREEFESMKQREMQREGTDYGSDRGSDRSLSPVVGARVGGMATTSIVGAAATAAAAAAAAAEEGASSEMIAERVSRARTSNRSSVERHSNQVTPAGDVAEKPREARERDKLKQMQARIYAIAVILLLVVALLAGILAALLTGFLPRTAPGLSCPDEATGPGTLCAQVELLKEDIAAIRAFTGI